MVRREKELLLRSFPDKCNSKRCYLTGSKHSKFLAVENGLELILSICVSLGTILISGLFIL